ncbi:MAG: methyltransferase domain-containing protein [Ruminococcus sp.]|nr:methyltransferase domain-containing protein [Ruminococcus sp.]MDE7104244.1 methyltransferase domain-containing protein [Ruminococcus sp.]
MKAKFLTEYIKHPKTIGAVAPSSKYLAKSMIKNIDFSKCSAIAEYGAGTGIFTSEVIRNRKRGTKFLVIEQNEYFYNILRKKFSKCHDVYIIHGDARNLEKYMKKYNIKSVDYIISGLPFASLPSKISDKILSSTRKILAENGGKFITFQYTLFKINLFKRFFDIVRIDFTLHNIPPAFVLNMTSKK